mgnify:CR=1 FL=1
MRFPVSRRSRHFRVLQALAAAAFIAALPGCELRQAMYNQPKYEALESSTLFANGQASRLPIEGTIARGGLRFDDHLYRGKSGEDFASTLPMPVTVDLLERGQERFDVFCSPCHDRTGNGNGMIVQRGLKRPPSLHEERLRTIPVGHFYDVITNGFGVMYSYASRIPVEDRWAIAGYIRALQLSQNAEYSKLPAEDRKQLDD